MGFIPFTGRVLSHNLGTVKRCALNLFYTCEISSAEFCFQCTPPAPVAQAIMHRSRTSSVSPLLLTARFSERHNNGRKLARNYVPLGTKCQNEACAFHNRTYGLGRSRTAYLYLLVDFETIGAASTFSALFINASAYRALALSGSSRWIKSMRYASNPISTRFLLPRIPFTITRAASSGWMIATFLNS